MSAPGLPSPHEWEKLSPSQRLDALYQAIQQVWGSLIVTGQELAGRVERAERSAQHAKDVLEKFSQRIKMVEDHPALKVED